MLLVTLLVVTNNLMRTIDSRIVQYCTASISGEALLIFIPDYTDLFYLCTLWPKNYTGGFTVAVDLPKRGPMKRECIFDLDKFLFRLCVEEGSRTNEYTVAILSRLADNPSV